MKIILSILLLLSIGKSGCGQNMKELREIESSDSLNKIISKFVDNESEMFYYNDTLSIIVEVYKREGLIFFHLTTSKNKVGVYEDIDYFGYNKINDHYVFYTNEVFSHTKDVFKITGSMKLFPIIAPVEKSNNNSQGNIIIDVIEDDTFNYWDYIYKDGEFFLIGGDNTVSD